MVEVETVAVLLQSGKTIDVHAWSGSDKALPMIIVAPEAATSDWHSFVEFLSLSHSPIHVDVTSAYDLLLLIWEIGEPALVLAQGQSAVEMVGELVVSSPAAASSIVISDGEIPETNISSIHEIETLILRGRQGKALSHEAAVRMHASLRNSILTEPENCGDFPAKDNPDATAGAVNWFIGGTSAKIDSPGGSEPVDPKPSAL